MNARRLVLASRSPRRSPPRRVLAQADRSAAAGARPGHARSSCPPSSGSPSRTGSPSCSSPCTRCRWSRSVLVVRAGATADPAGREGLARDDRGHARRGRRREGRARPRRRDRLPRRRARDRGLAGTPRPCACACRSPASADALPLMADVALRPDFPENELDAPAQGGADRPPPGAGRARQDRLARAGAGGVRDGPPLRPARGRRRRVDRGLHGRRPAGLPRRALRARRPRPSSSPGDVTRDVLPAAREGVRRVARPAAPAPAPAVPPPAAAQGPDGLARRQAGRRAVRDPDRRASGRPGSATRLPGGRGHEHAARRLVHLAPQRQPARAARLHLRGRARAFALPDGRALRGRCRRADRQDGPGRDRVREGARRGSGRRRRRRRWSARAATPPSATPASSRPRSRSPRKVADQVVYDLPDDGFFEEFVPKALAVDAADPCRPRPAAVDPARHGVRGRRATARRSRRRCGPWASARVRTLTVDDVMGPAPKVE